MKINVKYMEFTSIADPLLRENSDLHRYPTRRTLNYWIYTLFNTLFFFILTLQAILTNQLRYTLLTRLVKKYLHFKYMYKIQYCDGYQLENGYRREKILPLSCNALGKIRTPSFLPPSCGLSNRVDWDL